MAIKMMCSVWLCCMIIIMASQLQSLVLKFAIQKKKVYKMVKFDKSGAICVCRVSEGKKQVEKEREKM